MNKNSHLPYHVGQRILMLVSLLLLAVATFAVPAKPGLTRLLTLTDGTTVNAVLVGDEHGHFWRGTDGKSYQMVVGTDTYQEVNGQDIVHKAQQRRVQANQRRTRRLAPRKVGNVGSITGDKKGLIILVNFSDVSFTATQNDFYRLANDSNYNSGKYKGSMYDYFYAQSDGQFRLKFDVVGPVTVSNTQAYYGSNDDNGDDQHAAEMVIEALKLADPDVNFADYDWDSDGIVEQVYVVYAGKGEADGGAANTIWPHEYDLNSAHYYEGDGSGAQTLDGVTINTYACGGEQNGSTGETAGIGTMCHEFSHCLGYPDFYDTDYNGGQGMGYWDLMCSGSYNGDGYQPAGYTSYERWVAGWKEPTPLVDSQTISNMAALQTTGSNSYIIYNKSNNNEYYLLENRQKIGWDASLPGEGLLILHVDYSASVWSDNEVNNTPSHQRMTWVAADNDYQYTIYDGIKYYDFSGMANDPFPYGSVNAFGKNTTPAATLYNSNSDGTNYLDCSIQDITQNSDGTISFYFDGESNMVPVPPAIVAEDSITFSTAVGTPQTKQLEVLSEGLTEDITLTLTDANSVFSLGATTISKSLEEATVDVTFSPTTVGDYSGTITLTSAGAEPVTVPLTATAILPLPTTPAGLTLSEVTSTSLTASWSAVANADSYEIDVVKGASFTVSPGEPVLESDFSDTSDWTLSGTGTYTGAGYYGNASPSIKFDGTGDYAISPDFGSGTKLQFWALGNNGSGSTFAISGLVNGSWTDIETVTIAKGGATYEVNLPDGTSQVRFDFTKSVNCALDDVIVYGPGNSPESVDGYPKSVGNVTSYAVTGLASETQYAVRVRAVNSGGNSDWSDVASFTTEAAPEAPKLTTSLGTSIDATEGEDVEFTVTATGHPTPTIEATCTEGAYYIFENNEFWFECSTVGTYHFEFTATNDHGSDQLTVTITVSPAPVTVPELTVNDVTATTAEVSWTACDGVSSYTIQLASDDQFTTGGSGGSGETLTETFANVTFSPGGSSYTAQTISGGALGTWTATSCRGDKGSPLIRYDGTLTSPTIADGVAAVEFDYSWPFSESSTCDIELYVGGTLKGTVTVTGGTAGTATYTLNSPVAGPTTIEFRNKATSDKRMLVTEVRITPSSSGSYGGGSLIAEATVTQGTSYTFTNLTPETTYYARVKGDAGWSDVEEFLTENPDIDPAIAYYKNADGKQGAALKTAMSGIIYNRTEQGYDDLWTAFQTTDVRSDGKIWDMYSNITGYDPYNDPHSNSSEGSGFNREHSFPKSWFGGEVMPMFTDLHHLYPVDGNINTRRSNNPYGETNGEDYKSANDFSKLGACTYPGYTGKVFEPADEYKGDFARTYFYMITCYEEKLHDWYTNYSTTEVTAVIDGSTYPGFQTWQLNMLMKWAKNDPVSEKEMNRNNAVYAIQNNRNPFIDYPGLEEYVWGSLTSTPFSYDHYVGPVYKQDVTMSFDLAETTAILDVDFTEPALTTDPAGLAVSYSSSDEGVATVNASSGEVTLVSAGTTTITASFAGNDSYNEGSASYTLTVANPSFALGETLLYEGLTNYSGADGTQVLSSANTHFNYRGWTSLTKVYAGGTSNAYNNSGGCLKLGSGSAAGSMTTGSISLTSGGTLTFYLKKYGSDTGELKVTVEGDDNAEVVFTPTSGWTLCTVNLSEATGNVTITLATTSNRAYVDEIKLTSNGTLDLANAGDNATNIAAAADNGGMFNVTLKDRTLYKDGSWNTLCLPFDVDLEAIYSPIAGFGLTVMELNGTTSNLTDGTLTLNFTTVYDGDTKRGNLMAGTPYIIKWYEDKDNPEITDPVFYGVTINNTASTEVSFTGGSFRGAYSPVALTVDDKSNLFLGADNTLYYPNGANNADGNYYLNACRAYFHIDDDAHVKDFVLNFGEDATGIASLSTEPRSQGETADGWFTLDGRRLDGKPTAKGLYIHGGRKVIVQ